MFKEYKENPTQENRNKIVEADLRLVPYISWKYAVSSGIEQENIESFGYEGLIIAVEKFDLSYDVRFSTYAFIVIKQYIFKGMEELKEYRAKNNLILKE